MPADEGIRLDGHQGATPGEHAAQNEHDQSGRIMGPVWFHPALLEQSELFAQEKILGSQCAARPGNEHEETEEIAGEPEQRVEAVRQQLKNGARHERLTLHVTRRYAAANWAGTEFLRTTGQSFRRI